MEIISRAEANAQGLNHYFTGKPCKRGHIDKRRVADKTCMECRREDARIYATKNQEQRAESQRRFAKKNKEAEMERNRQWRAKNPEIYLEQRRLWRAKNKDNESVRNRNYYKKNKEKSLARDAKRRGAKRQAIPSWFSEFDEFVFQQAYELSALRHNETGIAWHVDHMIPLRARKCCGLHCADNIQVIPSVMNLEKHNKMQLTKPLEWLKC